jgi:hypothetical protein
MGVDEEDWSSGECRGDSLDRMLAQFGNNNHLDNTWQVRDLGLNVGVTTHQQGFGSALIKCGSGSSIFSKLRIQGFENQKF